MMIDLASPREVRQTALRMRDADYAEFIALSWANSREDLADELAARTAAYGALAVRHGADVIAIGSLVEARPNVRTLYFFATDRFNEVALPLTRFVLQKLFKPARLAGAHRIECVSMAEHTEAHKWIKALGLSFEAVCPGYGKNGEDYFQFAWVKNADTTGDC